MDTRPLPHCPPMPSFATLHMYVYFVCYDMYVCICIYAVFWQTWSTRLSDAAWKFWAGGPAGA